jgi:hypothetical protein
LRDGRRRQDETLRLFSPCITVHLQLIGAAAFGFKELTQGV